MGWGLTECAYILGSQAGGVHGNNILLKWPPCAAVQSLAASCKDVQCLLTPAVLVDSSVAITSWNTHD